MVFEGIISEPTGSRVKLDDVKYKGRFYIKVIRISESGLRMELVNMIYHFKERNNFFLSLGEKW